MLEETYEYGRRQGFRYRIWILGLALGNHYKLRAFGAKLGLFWDSFRTFSGLLVVIFIWAQVPNLGLYLKPCEEYLHFGHQLPIPRLTGPPMDW